MRIAREDPRSGPPRADGVFGQPPPDRGSRDPGHDAPSAGLGGDVGDMQTRQGTPSREGSSQASALTATTTSGGKDRWAAASGAFLGPGQTLFEEAFCATWRRSRVACRGGRRSSSLSMPAAAINTDLGANDAPIRQRIATSSCLQLAPLPGGQGHDVRALSWHRSPPGGEPIPYRRPLLT